MKAPGVTRGAKTRGTEWWTPPADTPLNLAIPYVVSIVDDGLSLAQSRVLACITNTQDGAKRQTGEEGKERGYLCDPGGYSRIARKCGLCRKTVYNAIKALIAKGVLRVWERVLKGRQRTKTLYFALHYGDILPAWRADKKWFHCVHKDAVVVRKRSKQFVTVEEAKEWRMDPARAPKRGSGWGLSDEPFTTGVGHSGAPIAVPIAIHEVNDEDLGMVHAELLRWTEGVSCLSDAIDVIADARSEAKKQGYAELGYGGPLPALTVVEMIRQAAALYKPSRHYPAPTVGWFLGGSVRRQVARELKVEWEQKQG